MKRVTVISLLVGIPLIALIVWIGSNSQWVDAKVPMPPKGEALINPFYAVQRFAEALGARTSWDRTFTTPPPKSVLVLSAWHWDLSTSRREALERWVESGGRLVVDRSMAGGVGEFERWSGVFRNYHHIEDGGDEDDEEEPSERERQEPCRAFEEIGVRNTDGVPTRAYYTVCDVSRLSFLTTSKGVRWALRDGSGFQALRVDVKRGSVTVINAAPFRGRGLFDGDHGLLFVAAADLRGGDEVHFLSEDDHPSLLALVWQHGAPVVVLGLVVIALALWRGAVRFGPLAAPTPIARRSLAEQIRGTGQFALRHGGGESLYAASARALDEAAQRRIPSYVRLSAKERAAALARLTRFGREAILSAIYHPESRRPHHLRNSIALLEAARRQTLTKKPRLTYGTD